MSKSKQNQPRPEGPAPNPPRENAATASRREQLRAQQAADAQRARTRRIVIAAATALALLIVAVVAVVVFQNYQRDKERKALQAEQGQITPPSANEAGDGVVYNNSTANGSSLVVEGYLDFQCPGCAQASATIDPLLEELADRGDIQLTYHMLHGLDRAIPGNNSYRAAIASICADVQGVYSQYSKTVFTNQPQEGRGYTDEELIGFAEQVGLSGTPLTEFEACFTGGATSDFVDAMMNGQPDYVTYTPFFAVNGKEWKPTGADLASADTVLAALRGVAG